MISLDASNDKERTLLSLSFQRLRLTSCSRIGCTLRGCAAASACSLHAERKEILMGLPGFSDARRSLGHGQHD